MNLYDMCLTGKYNTDKYYDRYKFHSYIENVYSNLFSPLKESVKNVLEIGILNGGSLELWRDYFNNATIIGVDIDDPWKELCNERIIQIMADAYSHSFLNFLPDDYFDIIIDDGPHTPESQIFFVKNYANKVKKGGLMICEDISSEDVFKKMQLNIPIFCKEYCLFNLSDKDNRFDSRLLAIRK